MSLKSFIAKMDELSLLNEATKETEKGRIHKAEPGGYGRKYDTDEEGDEKKKETPAVKRGRGRPKKGSDETGEVKKYDWSAFGVKSGKDVKLPKHDKSKTTKHSLKEYFDAMDEAVNEMVQQQPIPVVSKQGQTQSTGAGFIHIDDNSPAGQAMKDAIGKLAQQKKAQIVVPTAQQTKPGQPTATTGGATSQPAMSEEGEKWIQKAVKHPGAFTAKAKAAGKSVAAFAKEKAHAPGTLGKQARLAQTLRKINKEDMNEADLPPQDGLLGAGLGAGRKDNTFEGKKPDFLDLDKDGNKKESMKKAASDAKKDKKKVKEGMEHRHKAARHAGKAHALAKEGYNCRYDDMEEAKCYHEGYKEGLDECYGQMPVQGYVGETMPAATVPGMASQSMPAMEDDMYEMDKTAYMKQQAIKTPGPTFKAFGQTMHDKDVLEADSMFENWDKELNALLTENTKVDEGMSVSISKGQQGMPDTVSVSAQDAEAEQLLGLIKQAGMGLFGGDEHNGYGAPQGDTPQHGGIDVVDDNDGMMALIKKVTGGESPSADYADEEGHDEVCDTCGHNDCQCDHEEQVDEVESEDQMTYQVAEESPQEAGAEEEAETAADEETEAAEDEAAANYDKSQEVSEAEDDEQDVSESISESVKLDEWANEAGKKGTDAAFEADIDFMMNVISSGLNKRKSTGQTTIPVIAGQNERMQSHNTKDINEDITDWKKLAGI